jgi:hypothetical protein
MKVKTLFLLFALLLLPQVLYACSVCFGDPASLQSKALGAAVFFLLGTVGGVLGAVGYAIFACMRRAKKLSQIASAAVS